MAAASADQRRGDMRLEDALADDSASPFVGGLLGALFGLSLGREGPSIQIGASGAQCVSHRLRGRRREDMQEHYLVTAGAAAGLSAAFSAPLSGMMFALEGVHRSFRPRF